MPWKKGGYDWTQWSDNPIIGRNGTRGYGTGKVGADIPLLIGGATTSQLHTALKIAPVYHAPVVHLKDASQNATVAARLMNPKAKEELKEKLSSEYQRLREKSVTQAPKTVSLEEAQKNKLNLF